MGYYSVLEVFFKYTPRFTNVEKVTFLGCGMFDIIELIWTPSFPHPVTCLTFGPETTTTDPVQIRDTMVQLSTSDNADDLLLSEPLAWVGRRSLLRSWGGDLVGNYDSSEGTLSEES